MVDEDEGHHVEDSGSPEEQGSSVDEHEDACYVCGGAEGSDRLLCDGAGCRRVCHAGCTGLDAVPDGDWFCSRCREPPRKAPRRQVRRALLEDDEE